MRRIRQFCFLLLMAGFGAASIAQSAHVIVTHDDLDGLVTPGQIVRVRVTLSWTGATEALRIVGDAAASPDVGHAGPAGGNLGFALTHNYGQPVLGSVRGVDLGNSWWPMGFSPWYFSGGLHFLEYD